MLDLEQTFCISTISHTYKAIQSHIIKKKNWAESPRKLGVPTNFCYNNILLMHTSNIYLIQLIFLNNLQKNLGRVSS